MRRVGRARLFGCGQYYTCSSSCMRSDWYRDVLVPGGITSHVWTSVFSQRLLLSAECREVKSESLAKTTLLDLSVSSRVPVSVDRVRTW